MFKVYHGTTHDFNEFDSSVHGNIEGHYGNVNYFSSSEYDSEANYLSEGSDLTSRISMPIPMSIMWRKKLER